MRTDLLAEPIEGLSDALDAVDGFDRALTAGLARPSAASDAALSAVAAALAATPLAARVAEAAEKTVAGAADEGHLSALAAARAALLGAAHDALLSRIDEALGRTRAPWEHPATAASESANLSAAARSWLCDLARTGWQGIDHDVVAGVRPVAAAMLPDLAQRRIACLIDGFAAELAASCPGAALQRVPVRRWADLWTRAVLLTQPGAADRPATGVATGRLLPLGVDLHQHATAAQAQVHAVYEPSDGSPPRLVRASVSTTKPDTVIGAGVWQVLRPHMSLLSAYSEGQAMTITAMPITAAGDLIWDNGRAGTAGPADPFATARVALTTAAASPTTPLDRHPVQIAEPVHLQGYTAATDGGTLTFTVGGLTLPVDTGRLPHAGPLTPDVAAASTECIALLRWDAGAFTVQPLAVQATVKGRPLTAHAGAWAGQPRDQAAVNAEKEATAAVAVLRERAGKLLRR